MTNKLSKYTYRSKDIIKARILCPIHGMTKTNWLYPTDKTTEDEKSIGCYKCYEKLKLKEKND